MRRFLGMALCLCLSLNVVTWRVFILRPNVHPLSIAWYQFEFSNRRPAMLGFSHFEPASKSTESDRFDGLRIFCRMDSAVQAHVA